TRVVTIFHRAVVNFRKAGQMTDYDAEDRANGGRENRGTILKQEFVRIEGEAGLVLVFGDESTDDLMYQAHIAVGVEHHQHSAQSLADAQLADKSPREQADLQHTGLVAPEP